MYYFYFISIKKVLYFFGVVKEVKIKNSKKNWVYGYALLFPSVFLIVCVFVYPIIQVIKYSFVSEIGGQVLYTLKNYQTLIGDIVFRRAMLNNIYLLLTVPVLVVFCLILAVLLYEGVKGWKFFRSLLLLPFMVSIAITGIIFTQFFVLNGAFNSVLQFLHLDFFAHDWLVEQKFVIPTLMVVIIWREAGFGVILLLARLMTIDETLVEAARMDGANWFNVLLHIYIPQLFGILQFYVVIEIIAMLGWLFEYIYIMFGTYGGVNSTWTIDVYVYKMMIHYGAMGVASAGAVIMMILASIVIFFRYKVSQRMEIE